MTSIDIALNRLTFGRPFSDTLFDSKDLSSWLEDQLHPDHDNDPEYIKRMQSLRLPIKYQEAKDWQAVDEVRPLQWINSSIDELWRLNNSNKSVASQEKNRPRIEVSAVTLLKAVYSRWQLQEIICDFWHNHFNVNAADQNVGMALPVYDRDVIRTHCFGNFKAMLEAVATSPAMLWYLNNRSSRAGAPNENYAREFFELHTMGRDAYLNGIYNHWKDVPGATEGRPKGYIDQDVYEAARAFTGWTIEDGGNLGGGQLLPRTGKFTYVESWHDNYQKRILGNDIDPYQPPMADGRKVISLAATHAATAYFLAKKLCIRLVSDSPPESLITAVAKVWVDAQNKPDQIAHVIRYIVMSKEFSESKDAKIKRPLELVASYIRAIGIEFTPSEGLLGEMSNAGQSLFSWPTPTGHPDLSSQWLGPNAMRRRWTLIAGLTDNWWGTGMFDALAPFGNDKITASEFVNYWLARLYNAPASQLMPMLLNTAKLSPNSLMKNPGTARHLVAWAAMSPEFQLR